MGDWQRSTRECPFEGLQSEMTVAINEHVEQYGLGMKPSEVLMCIETTSESIRKGLPGGGDKAVLMGAIVTEYWLIWAIRGESPEVVVMSARLADVVVQDYAATQFAKLVPDSGIEVSGSFTGVPERGSAFIGLDEGLVSQKFRDTVLKALQAARK